MELEQILFLVTDTIVFISNSIIILGTVTNPPVRMGIVTLYLFLIYLIGGWPSYVIAFACSIGMIVYRIRYEAKMKREVEEYLAKQKRHPQKHY
jgi:flagellar biosynthesis component FlhA